MLISRGELYTYTWDVQTPRGTYPTLSTVYKWQSYSITSKESVSTDMALEQTLN